MPMLRDDGPPVSMSTIQEARQTLPVEYGYKIVDENGRRVLLVRTPRPKPDYLHELAEVALYVSLDEMKDLKDIVLIGTEKATRLEPRILRDHIRDQMSQDGEIAAEMAKRLDRNYAYTIIRAPRAATHVALAIRIPRPSVSQISADDVKQIRQVLAPVFDGRIKDCQLAFIIADQDFERLGRRVFVDLVAPDLAPTVAPPAPVAIELPGRAVPTAPAPVAAPSKTPSIAARLGAASAPRPASSDVIVAPSTPQGVGAAWTPNSVAPPVAPAPKPTMTSILSDDNTEVFVRKPASESAPAPVAAPTPPVPAAHAPAPATLTPVATAPPPVAERVREMERTVETEEYEVFVSKPKAPRAPAPEPAIAAPPAAPPAPVAMPEPAPAPAPEVATATPPVVPSPSAAPAATPSRPLVAGLTGPTDDHGMVVEPVIQIQDDADVLSDRLRKAGYQVVRDVEANGEVFEAAAHKPDGKRILVKRVPKLDETLAASLAQLSRDLSADVCMVLAGSVVPGARLATFGTPVVAFAPGEARTFAL